MATITAKVYPGGGGDYTSLASALSLISATSADEVIIIFGPGNFGTGHLESKNWHSLTLQIDTGYMHSGVLTQATAGIAYTTGQLIHDVSGPTKCRNVVIDGIRFEVMGLNVAIFGSVSTAVTASMVVKNCLFNAPGGGSALDPDASAGTYNVTVTNNIAISTGAGGSDQFYFAVDGSGSAVLNLSFDGNSAYLNDASPAESGVLTIDLSASVAGDQLNLLSCHDNAMLADAVGVACFNLITGPGTFAVTSASNNASSDSTSTTFGATGCLTGLTPTNLFVDPLTDLHFKSGSVLNGAGVAVAGMTTDNQGRTRPSPPSIGAFEASRHSAGKLGSTFAMGFRL